MQEIGYIKSHYNIEDFIYFNHHRPTEHAHLHHFILNPVFAAYSKHMLKVFQLTTPVTLIYTPYLYGV